MDHPAILDLLTPAPTRSACPADASWGVGTEDLDDLAIGI